MSTTLSQQILDQLIHYVNSLDWPYILTFIMMAYALNHQKVKQQLRIATRLRVRTRYRVAAFGLIYAVFVYYLRGYVIAQVETLLQSFVFAMIFHKLIIDTALGFINKARGSANVNHRENGQA